MRDVHDLTAGDPPVVADCTQDDILQAVHALAAAVDDLTAAVNTSHAALVASFDALAAAIVDNNSHDAAAIVDGNHTASLTETLNNNIHDATFHKLNETVNYLAVHTFSTANDETVRTVRTSIVPTGTNTRVYMYIYRYIYPPHDTRHPSCRMHAAAAAANAAAAWCTEYCFAQWCVSLPHVLCVVVCACACYAFLKKSMACLTTQVLFSSFLHPHTHTTHPHNPPTQPTHTTHPQYSEFATAAWTTTRMMACFGDPSWWRRLVSMRSEALQQINRHARAISQP